jgi:protein involved in polysaccharide export with SLBB domain
MHAFAFSYWRRGLAAVVVCAAFLATVSFAAPATSAPSARRIMAGDRLNISVKEQSDLNRVYAVAGDGSVDFAFAGRVVIGELTADEAARKLE